jgi:predicted glutamine amidotransferase
MVPSGRRDQAFIIASEPLTEERESWVRVPKNTMIAVTPQLNVSLRPLT